MPTPAMSSLRHSLRPNMALASHSRIGHSSSLSAIRASIRSSLRVVPTRVQQSKLSTDHQSQFPWSVIHCHHSIPRQRLMRGGWIPFVLAPMDCARSMTSHSQTLSHRERRSCTSLEHRRIARPVPVLLPSMRSSSCQSQQMTMWCSFTQMCTAMIPLRMWPQL